MRHLVPASLCVALVLRSVAVASDPAIVPVTVVIEGQSVNGVGLVTAVDNLAVNSLGQFLVEADTDNANTNADTVVVDASGLRFQEGQVLLLPAGATLDSFDALTLNDAGNAAWNLFIAGTTTSTDSGIYFNDTLTLLESTISTATAFTAPTPYIGFFETKFNNNGQVLVVASVDDPAIASTVDRALVIFDVDPVGTLLGESVVAKEGDVLAGQTAPVADFGTGPHNFAFSDGGDSMFFADTTDATTVDGNVYVNNTLLAREGSPSPIAARTWLSLSSSRMDLSPNGQHYVYTGQLSAPTTDDQLVVRDGVKFIQEGDSLPDIAPFLFTAFGTGGIRITDSGDVVWIGDWDDPNTAQDVGLFYNHKLLVQEGVTQINGQAVESISTVQDDLSISSNGRYILFEATLVGGLNGAFLIDLGPWTDLGGSLAGTNGAPRLRGAGALVPSQFVSFTVSEAAPNAQFALVLGLTPAFITPFYGGTLLPTPHLVISGFSTDANGNVLLPGVWPGGFPSGGAIFAQALVADAGAPFGVAISNAVVGSAP
ncbi:MAG: hypothetical protein IPH13_17920 [Planctomycetes bacterium]|nr:hypothetical protein [Planctomycetota bacterium]